MPREMKKRAVVDRIREKYLRASRTPRLKHQEEIALELSPDDLPCSLSLTFDELGEILLEIERDYGELITAKPPGARSRREYYRVGVNASAFPAELLAQKYTLSRHDGWWCLTLPGELNAHRIGRVGSLKGELFAELSRRLGRTINPESLPENVANRTTNRRTTDPDMRQIRNALREINVTMHGEIQRRFRLRPRGARVVQVQWKNMLNDYLWSATVRRIRGRWRVGIVKGQNPPMHPNANS